MSLTKDEFFVRDLVIDDEYGIIDSEANVMEAAKLMKQISIPDLVVVDKTNDKILGVIADFDIIKDVLAEGLDPKTTKTVDVMYIITPVTLDTKVEDAFERMRDLQVNVVPVIDKGKLVGVCTIQDCWSYIPDQVPDEIGLIPIKNTRVAEFWFASVCAILALILGVVFPLAGIYSYFSAEQTDIISLFGLASVRGGELNFYLFEAHGIEFFASVSDLIALNGPIWGFVVACSFLVVLVGIIAMFSIVYTSFIDIRYLQKNMILKYIIPGLFIVFLVFEWILYAIGFSLAGLSSQVRINSIGLTMSIISMVLIILAINRDYIFRESGVPQKQQNEGG